MATPDLIKFAFQIFLILLGVHALMYERELIRFERRAAKYIKAFFKALYYTIKGGEPK